jgi:surface antigen
LRSLHVKNVKTASTTGTATVYSSGLNNNYEQNHLLGGNQNMRTTVLKVSLLMCAFLLFTGNKVEAISADYLGVTDLKVNQTIAQLDEASEKKAQEAKEKEADEKKADDEKAEQAKKAEVQKLEAQKPVEHTVVAGESLSKIAKAHSIEWKRLFNKNVTIIDPDRITVGAVIIVPKAEEVLEDRVIVAPEPVAPVVQHTATTARRSGGSAAVPQASAPSRQVARGSSAGNTYAPGYCTWYVKSRRPDIPNRMGNASSWVSSARSQGFATGSAPQVGAVAQSGNHVAYVEAVNGNTVTVSEMNWVGLYVTSTRTTSAGSFTYIY